MKRSLHETAFWALATLTLALGVLLMLVMSGRLVSEPAPPTTEAAPPTVTEPPPATSAPALEPAPESEPQPVALTISASRGDCWVSARRGSETGETLFEGLLPEGESLELEGRVWLLLGASANVDVTLDGKDVSLPAGTVETVLPPPENSS